VILSGGVQAKNVIWQNVGNVKIQAGAFMQGIILCFTDVAIETGAREWCYMAQTVALQKATVTATGMCDGSSYEPVIALAGIDLKSACGYAVLSKSGISTVPNSNIVGNIGVSPITAAAMTGFSLDEDVGGQFALSAQVTGHAHGASYGGAIAASLTVAVLDMQGARMPQTASTWMYRG
jgi:hypothetical protein